MKRFAALACLCVSLASCAHQSQWGAVMEPLKMQPFCMPRAMSPYRAPRPGAPGDFRTYYEAFLDAKEQGRYVDCLKKRWRVPWLHAEYRRGRRWLKISWKAEAENAPPAGAGARIVDVEESFASQGGGKSLRRVTISFADGARKVVEETFSSRP